MSEHDKHTRLKQLKHVAHHLAYPLGYKQLIETAREEGGGDDIVDLFSSLPKKTYASSADLLDEIKAIHEQSKKKPR